MSITAKELAKILNISAAAVSMALNNKPGVSHETRLRIFEAAQKYGYDFGKITEKSDYAKAHRTICFLIFKRYGAVVSDTQFFSELTQSIDEYCKNSNLFLQIKYVYDSDNFNDTINDLKANNCKGIILLGTEILEGELRHFAKSAIPMVVLDTYYASTDCNYVKINNCQGVHLAVTELVRKYENNIGYLSSAYHIENYAERADSFFNTIKTYGFSQKQIRQHKLTPSLDGAYSDMCDILAQKEPVAKAYFADNDLIAYGAIKAFQEFGYRIPEDIEIIGFDDIPMCRYSTPSLSTIHVNIRALAKTAIMRLLEITDGDNSFCTKTEINTQLIRRNSFS